MHSHEPRSKRLHTDDVVLDIGDGVGALMLYTNPELVGHEVEVSRKDQESRIHTVVHERRIMGRTVFAGVFPELSEGDYRVWTDDPRPVAEVTIVSGQVTEVDLRR